MKSYEFKKCHTFFGCSGVHMFVWLVGWFAEIYLVNQFLNCLSSSHSSSQTLKLSIESNSCVFTQSITGVVSSDCYGAWQAVMWAAPEAGLCPHWRIHIARKCTQIQHFETLGQVRHEISAGSIGPRVADCPKIFRASEAQNGQCWRQGGEGTRF